MKCVPYGEGAVFVDLELADAPDRREQTHRVARALSERLPAAEIVLGAGTIAIIGTGAFDELGSLVAEAVHHPAPAAAPSRIHTIPTVYDGPDLDEVARRTDLSTTEVAALHASRGYVVELIGFLPGFAYMGPLDPKLVLPRRDAPRVRVAPNTVAIAAEYTGIYPGTSPGGWHLIGRAVGVTLFDPRRDPPSLLRAGDIVQFVIDNA